MRWLNAVSGGGAKGVRTRRSATLDRSDATADDAGAVGLTSDARRTGGDGLATVGRLVLWTCIGVVLIRGLGAILGGDGDHRAASAPQGARLPDGEARAFAVRFAQTYLGGSARTLETHRRAVTAFFADDVAERMTSWLPPRGSGARVGWATIARESTLGRSRALITVAVSTGESVRYLTVPVARDRAGGLVVFDLPSLSAAPAKGTVDVPEPTALPEAQARPITDLVTRFLKAYVAGGDRAALAYFLAPGARLVQMSRGLEAVEVEQVARDPYPARRGVGVVALVRVRDRATDAELALRYRLTLVERERWYVQVVAGGPSA